MYPWFTRVRDEQFKAFARHSPGRLELLEQLDAVHLFATFDFEAVMKRDGTILVSVVDDWLAEEPRVSPWREATLEEQSLSLVAAKKDIPELAALIPTRPNGAEACSHCKGNGEFQGILCSNCGAMGWIRPPAA